MTAALPVKGRKRMPPRSVVRRGKGMAAPPPIAGYAALLDELKARIRAAQVKAALSVNRELILLYWDIGKSIVERQRKEGWGRSVVERLARDLQAEFPGISGFSPQNMWYMRAFYLAWTVEVANLQQPVGELDGENLPQAVGEIPWGHNLQLLSKLNDPSKRFWYAQKTIEHGWSRAVLVHQIESSLYERQGKAVTNFDRALPPPQSDLARQALKDPYVFDFLTLTEDAAKRELERGLLAHIRKFLLELGTGFAFVGQQHHLDKSKIIVEYALRDTRKPMGVASYRLTASLPRHLKGSLPSIEELEAELGGRMRATKGR